ncbi:ECF-type sigma factor [Paludibaculum fermentans]|uniref:Sigma-70 family RNA polymerase sigma factor n=1 Tax=Paludibaculum fermentans TaxID=1473598 RepID=A0A7S7SJR1_PALFE|nr:ECF-type sigma factor [Paludibaculum fermentans]QOY86230.1 sigma-70 family RNA polymerase sigma factor [Paludibaculum fermentans]
MSEQSDIDVVYSELRQIAVVHLSRSVRRPSLQATQLVHEAWLRLSSKEWKSRTHFLALASRTMRMLLIDAVRARMAERRGGGDQLSLSGDEEFSGPDGSMALDRVIDIDRALRELALHDERKARVVEMRFFGGLELQEVAEVLEVSLATVKRDWEFARTWLFARLSSTLTPGE